ncbi:MAG: class I SAM-dependent rRNA methyltransferase [Hyphomicrobiales bacterium]
MQTASSSLPAVEISLRAARRLGGGYLWVFSNEIEGHEDQPAAAYWCRFTRGRQTVATGYFNRHSLIAGRVVSFGEVSDLPRLMADRLRQALIRRRPLAGGQAARLVFSEADLLPGLVIDFYPPFAVIQSHTAGMDLMLPLLEEQLSGLTAENLQTPLEGLVVRCDAGIRQLEAVEAFSRVSFGEPAVLSQAEVQERGVRYAADLVAGQKTGFFLDQRENRLHFGTRIRELGGGRVLDLFCYSGGWGLRALHEGAHHVTFVDQSREALGLVERGLSANRIPMERASLHNGDVFDFLARNASVYDAVVVDPPAFVKSRKNLPQASKAYQKLNRLAWRRLRPGGLLFICSCSHHMAEADFLSLLAAAVAREQGLAQVVYRGGQAPDHPVLLSMPETAYLKCVGLQKMEPG